MARKHHLLSKFGITEEQYDYLLQNQDGRCAVCKRLPHEVGKVRLAVDHDHKTGQIRGLLCFRCNKFVVGRHRKEASELLKSAYEYLIAEYPGWVVPPKVKKKRNVRRKRSKKVR